MKSSESLSALEQCKWHEHCQGRVVGPEDDPHDACSHCGRLIETKECGGCKLSFPDWSVQTFDDVLSGPAATSDGDFVCIPCARRHASDERAREDHESACEGDWNEYCP